LQIIIAVLDVRGDRIPAGLPLHAYGRWFNNLPAGGQDNLIQSVRDASGCTGDVIRVTGGKRLAVEWKNEVNYAEMYVKVFRIVNQQYDLNGR
jgi:hypothetical protein